MSSKSVSSNGLSRRVFIIDNRVAKLELLAERQQEINLAVKEELGNVKGELGEQTTILKSLHESEVKRMGAEEARGKSIDRLVKWLQIGSYVIAVVGALIAALSWFSHHG